MHDTDVIIIGAGHNGLTAAAYLAAAGRRVTVLERRAVVGGACVSEELAPGYKASTCSYLVSLLAPDIIRDLDLARYGYRMIPRDPASFTPLDDGRYLMLGRDSATNQREISKFSRRDAEAYPRYEAFLTRVAEALEPILDNPVPALLPLPQSWRRQPLGRRISDLLGTLRLRRALARLGADQPAAMRLLLDSAQQVLDRWFESDVLKATLATDGVIGAMAAPSTPGTGYVLLHHVMGHAGGTRGVWGYAAGGMGAISQALAASAAQRGVEIHTQTSVAQIEHQEGRVTGVRLADGRVLKAPIVLSNATPQVTFGQLLTPDALPDGFNQAVAAIDYSSASAKINLAVSRLPDFSACPGSDEPGPQHRGTIHIGPSMDALERAYDAAKYGQFSPHPLIEMTIPSALDDSLAPPRHHIVQLFVQYAPYTLRDADWSSQRDRFADTCLAEIDRYAPGFSQHVLHRQVLTPVDLEREFALTGGNIFHGAMTPSQLLSLRPVPGWADHRSPLQGLYLCGSGAHPGGGVSGLPGRNAARAVLSDG